MKLHRVSMHSILLNALGVIYYASILENVASGADANWIVIASNTYYANYRLVTQKNFTQRRISKTIPKTWAHMDCATFCTAKKNCHAFSFYEKDDDYACDLAGDSYCTPQTGKALLRYNGSLVWDKINAGMSMGCFQPAPIPCENIRPGCDGNYPNCTYCIRTCRECKSRYNYGSNRTCMLWPDGSGLDSEPITVFCNDIFTTLFHREINVTTGESLIDVQLSFKDMGRLLRANSRQYFRFVQRAYGGGSPSAYYSVQAIDSNGTFFNISHVGGENILQLSGRLVERLSFVMVTNDIYGCGSFWLLDSRNATYCPGGPVRMFGTPIHNGINVTYSGIRFGDYYTNYMFVEAWLFLYPY